MVSKEKSDKKTISISCLLRKNMFFLDLDRSHVYPPSMKTFAMHVSSSPFVQ